MNVAESFVLGYDVTDNQLLATLLGESVARVVLGAYSSFEALSRASLHELQELKGVGEKQAVKIKSLVEFSRRLFQKNMAKGSKFSSPTAVFQQYGPMLRGLQQEVFYVILTDSRNRVLRHVEISKGTLNSCEVHARDILRHALKEGAIGVILLHNHPSGDPEPSPEDKALTEAVKAACDTCQLSLLDHVVVAGEEYVSFSERGLL